MAGTSELRQRPADWQSATQQINNLRYAKQIHGIASAIPRLERQRLPWVHVSIGENPNGVLANIGPSQRMRKPQPRCGWAGLSGVDPG
jgi:hypothetical protein